MPQRPLLILPSPGEPAKRLKQHSGPRNVHLPSPERQAERLGPKFTVLQRAFEIQTPRLRTDATGVVPEEVLVLETVGPVDGFINAVRRVPGMEWLAEIDEEDIPPDDDFFAAGVQGQPRPETLLQGRLFLVFSNEQALGQMLHLWQRWRSGERLDYGLGRWKTLFSQLRDIRPWGVRDRLQETGVLDDWRTRVEQGEGVVPCEIELWFRQDPAARALAEMRVIRLVEAQQGRVVSKGIVEEIAYHAVSAQLPSPAVEPTLRVAGQDIELLQAAQVQFFRPAGQLAAVMHEGAHVADAGMVPEPSGIRAEPVVALLDGFPIQDHRRLAGRLIVDDPEDFESAYQASERSHGTAMASMILHGDLDGNHAPLASPLYVRPVLQPQRHPWQAGAFWEAMPEGTLAVDLVHRAVRRVLDAEGQEPCAFR